MRDALIWGTAASGVTSNATTFYSPQQRSPLHRRDPWEGTARRGSSAAVKRRSELVKRLADPETISGGEAERVAIDSALLSGPRLLVMDEPLASLDAARREEIMRLIERIRDELLLPILYVSHDRSEVERLADQIIPIQPANTDL